LNAAAGDRSIEVASRHGFRAPTQEREEKEKRQELASRERCGLLGEALRKRAKAGHAAGSRLVGEARALQPSQPVDIPSKAVVLVGETGTFQRGRLEEWMALSARHAPPSKLGKRHVRAAPGGLQDAYIGAVRWCLTSATLKSRSHARAPDAASAGSASTAYEERPRGAGAALPGCQGDIQGPLVVAVREAHESAEGLLLVARVVAEAEVLLQALGHRAHGIVGGAESSARLLLHRQHPALQGQQKWLPGPGTLLQVHGFAIAAAGRHGRGPLLLPSEVRVVSSTG